MMFFYCSSCFFIDGQLCSVLGIERNRVIENAAEDADCRSQTICDRADTSFLCSKNQVSSADSAWQINADYKWVPKDGGILASSWDLTVCNAFKKIFPGSSSLLFWFDEYPLWQRSLQNCTWTNEYSKAFDRWVRCSLYLFLFIPIYIRLFQNCTWVCTINEVWWFSLSMQDAEESSIRQNGETAEAAEEQLRVSRTGPTTSVTFAKYWPCYKVSTPAYYFRWGHHCPRWNNCFRTLILCGFPNVGKSSFINTITRADVEVQPYAFTTKALYVGHLDYKFLRWQVGFNFHPLQLIQHFALNVKVIDTPGILDQPLEERNTIEMQAVTALAHLKAAVLFVMDISEQCDRTIEEQVST